MKNYYVIVETKKTEASSFKHRVAQIKVDGFDKLQIGYEWGKVTNKYPEEFFDSHISHGKIEMREYQDDPNPYMNSNKQEMKIRKIFYGNMASGKSVLAKQLQDVFFGYTYYITGDFGLQAVLLEIKNRHWLHNLSNEATVMFIIEDYLGTHTQEILEYFKDRNFPIIILMEKKPDLPKEMLKTIDVVKCSYTID